MKAKRLLTAGSIAIAALAAIPAHADADHTGDRCDARHHVMGRERAMGLGLIERMAGRLDLSKEQVVALRAIEDKYRPGLRDAWDRLRDSRKALAEVDPGNAARLREIADARGKAIADMVVLRTQVRADVGKVFTEEQKEKMREMRHHRWQEGGHRDGGHEHDGPGADGGHDNG